MQEIVHGVAHRCSQGSVDVSRPKCYYFRECLSGTGGDLHACPSHPFTELKMMPVIGTQLVLASGTVGSLLEWKSIPESGSAYSVRDNTYYCEQNRRAGVAQAL